MDSDPRLRVAVKPFVHKLYDMVNDPTCNDSICWDKTGESFHVLNEEKFSKEVLPLYYKSNVVSFVRQLNNYSFHKVKDTSLIQQDTDQLHYKHEYFQRGQINLLEFIIPKKQLFSLVTLNDETCLRRRRSTPTNSVTASFVLKLWTMVENPDFDESICWSKSGRSFLILKPFKLCKEVLPLFFKHNKLNSFIRQLNMYDFHRIPHYDEENKFAHDVMEYKQGYFKKGQKSLLIKIKNKRRLKTTECKSSDEEQRPINRLTTSIQRAKTPVLEKGDLQNTECTSEEQWPINRLATSSQEVKANTTGAGTALVRRKIKDLLAQKLQRMQKNVEEGIVRDQALQRNRRVEVKDLLPHKQQRMQKNVEEEIVWDQALQRNRRVEVKDLLPHKQQRMQKNVEEGIVRDQALRRNRRVEKGMLEIPNHACNLLQNLHGQQKTGKFCDIMFKTATGIISAHRSVLISGANALGDENKNLLEVIERKNTIVNIFEDFSQEIVQQLLLLMYTGKIMLSPGEEFENLKRVAVKLKFNKLLKMLSNVFSNSNDESVSHTESRQSSKESTTLCKMRNASKSMYMSSDSELEEMDFDEENTFEMNTIEQQEQTTDGNTCTDNSAPSICIDSSDSETLDGFEIYNDSNTTQSICDVDSQPKKLKGKECFVALPAPLSDACMSSSERKFNFSFANTITENNAFSDKASHTFQKHIAGNSEEQEKYTQPSRQNTNANYTPVDNQGSIFRRSLHVQNSQDQTLRGFGEVTSTTSSDGTVFDTTEKTFLPLKTGKPSQLHPRILEILSDVGNIPAVKPIDNGSEHGGLRTVKTEPTESISTDIEKERSNDTEVNNDGIMHSDASHNRATPVTLIKPCSVVLEPLPYKLEVDFDDEFTTVVVEQNF